MVEAERSCMDDHCLSRKEQKVDMDNVETTVIAVEITMGRNAEVLYGICGWSCALKQ